MKARVFAFFVFTCAILISANAFAWHFNSFEGGASCDGWYALGEIYITIEEYVDVNYEVTLMQGTEIVASFTGVERCYKEPPGEIIGTAQLDISMGWGVELCGDYEVSGTVYFVDLDGYESRENFSASFYCPCDEEEYCNFTPGFWKNHPEAWPVMNLQVGGMTYSMMQLMEIFDMSTKKDMSVKLAHHLIAAKLNVLSGSYNDIQDVIDDADAFLAAHSIGSNPDGDDRDYAEYLKDLLEVYNEMGCGEEEEMEIDYNLLDPTMNATDGGTVEDRSWGAIKDLYK